MEFNKRKFNIIVVFTVCLICLVVAFTAVDFSVTEIEDSGIISADDEELNEQEEENAEGVIDEKPNTANVPVISKKTQWQCLNYALNILNNSSYRLTWNQLVKTSMGINQSINKTVFKTGEKAYSKLVSTGFGEYNFTEYGYVDGETSVITNKNKAGNKVYNYNDYISNFGFSPDQLPYLINLSTCKMSVSNDARKNYYILEVTLNSKGYENYLKSIGKTAGDGSNPQISSLTLSIKVSKKYGRITSITAHEKYGITKGLRVSCDSTVTILISYGNYSNNPAVDEIRKALGVS